MSLNIRERAVRRTSGFTLVELMVTVAVLAILMALAGPSFEDFMQRYRLRGAADEVASIVANARAEALMRNRDVAVVFTGDADAWCVGAVAAPEPTTLGELASTAPTCDCDNDCTLSGRVVETRAASHSGVTMSADPGSVTFSRDTGAVDDLSSPTATLQSPNGKYSLNVAISPLGRGRLCVPTGSPAISGFEGC